jgi:hypothetical protein
MSDKPLDLFPPNPEKGQLKGPWVGMLDIVSDSGKTNNTLKLSTYFSIVIVVIIATVGGVLLINKTSDNPNTTKENQSLGISILQNVAISVLSLGAGVGIER